MKTVILLDAGHGINTPGKRSPDSSFLEWKWNREVVDLIYRSLQGSGIKVFKIVPDDYEMDMPLSERVRRAKVHCDSFGPKNCLYVSVHANAAGSGQWMNAQGWSAYTSKGQTASDHVADLFYDAAEEEFKDRKIRKDMSDGDRDWEADFYVLRKTVCPAILTENFFYDNREECQWLLTDSAKKRIADVHAAAISRYVAERETL